MPLEQVFKTLVVRPTPGVMLAVVPADGELDPRRARWPTTAA